MTHSDPYPKYALAERIADGVMHAAGVGFAITGTVFLLIWATATMDAGTIVGASVYGAALIASFVASACYHFTPWERLRPALRRIDHAAIYFKIAGTYTPLVVLIGSAFAYGVLTLVWVLAAIGAVAKLFFWGTRGGSGHMGTVLYLGLGWLSLALITSLFPVVPTAGLVLLGVGGATYTVGAVIFSLEGLRYQNAIWHGFVLAASVCFFAAIVIGMPQVA
ncbi:PAQR family membrane homeostasis protein TrhA [Pseudooctadecabacter jejudonensis]|nr:hemolysin III family protein [Pseudooctadecabacter jejudonensis]